MLPQHDVVCQRLIGRDSQIAAIRDVLSRAREPHGQVALIVGEAGVGKSRLLRAMTAEARDAGFFTLHGASFEAESSIPYAPLLDLIRLFSDSAPASVVAHVLAPAAAELIAVFPELRSILPDATPTPTIDPDSDKRRLLHSLAQVIATLARTQPVFIALEDVHWSDDATLDVIFHLARSCASQPVVFALTYRGEDAGPRLKRLVADLERARLVVELPVERLARSAVSDMLRAIFGDRGTLGDEFLYLLYGLTEGNPFFVEETLKALIITGDLAPIGGEGEGWRARPLERVVVPRTAVEAVRRRLAALTVPARAVASIAAVAGRRFDFALLQTLTDHDEPALLVLVKELIAAQLVVEESAERFAFRHALTREAIYVELLVRERVALHREVAAALAQSNAESLDTAVEALAYHTWEAGEWELAAAYSERAARHALALSAPRAAVAHLDRAFAAAERRQVQISTELLLLRGWANETLGEFLQADTDFVAALDNSQRSSDRAAEWEALHALGMLWAARDYARAGRYRIESLAVARSLNDGARVARSLNRVGNWHVNLEQPQAGLPHHQEALAIFERLEDGRGVAETVDLIAMAHHIAGDQRAASAFCERSVALFTEIDDRRGLANALAMLTLFGGSFHVSSTTPFATAAAGEELTAPRSVRLARDIGWRVGDSATRFFIADALAWRGEYDRAIPMALEALEQAKEIEHVQWTGGIRRLLGVLCLELGDLEAALDHLTTAYEIAQHLGSHIWIRFTAAPLATAYCRSSNIGAAIEVLDRAARHAGVAGHCSPASSADSATLTLGERQLWLSRAQVALAQHQPDLALQIAQARLDAEAAAHGSNEPSALGTPRLSLLEAQALTQLERFDEAMRTLDAARSEATAQGALPMLWRIEAAVGHVHRTLRHRLEARRAFDASRDVAGRLTRRIPDVRLREHFVREIESVIPSGPTPTPARTAKDALGGLTKRERDVAKLVAHGKPNRAIAHDLGIGERTVEGYVASALAKLNFRSRTQLAAWAVEKGVFRSPAR